MNIFNKNIKRLEVLCANKKITKDEKKEVRSLLRRLKGNFNETQKRISIGKKQTRKDLAISKKENVFKGIMIEQVEEILKRKKLLTK